MPTSLHLSVSHYLTETYLIGSMKVLMGLKQKFSKRSCQWKFTSAEIRNERFNFCVLSHFYLFFCSLSPSLSPLLIFPSLLLKYAKYLESYSTEGVRHIFKKACTIHLPKKPTIHVLWAAFEEQQGEFYCTVVYLTESVTVPAYSSSLPGLCEVTVNACNLMASPNQFVYQELID